jgi:hypothetical protein
MKDTHLSFPTSIFSPHERNKRPPSSKSPFENWKCHLTSSAILCSSFYFFQIFTQRCFGKLGLHGGLSNSVLTPIGCVSTVSTLLLSQNIETIARKNAPQFGLQDFFLPVTYKSPKVERRDNIKRLFLGFCSFGLLEQGMFRSCFPSSIISLGVFGNFGLKFKRSVGTDSALTTSSQRLAIQKLGRRFGCHHCGSRQLFSRQGFIADHMPPTKIAEDLSKSWWRKLLKIKVLDF